MVDSSPQFSQNNPDTEASGKRYCQEVLALIPAYSIGATDPAETAFVMRHLAECPEALAELQEYQAMSESMLVSATPRPAPARLQEKIIAALNNPPAPTIVKLPPNRDRAVLNKRQMWETAGRIAAAAAILLLVLSNLFWWRELQRVRDENNQPSAQLETPDDILALFSLGDTQRVELAHPDTQTESQANASLVWDPETQTALLYAQNFPRLSGEWGYQIWLVRGEHRISPGIFQVNENGVGIKVFTLSEPLTDYEGIGITIEPAAGSPGPTSPAVVVGDI